MADEPQSSAVPEGTRPSIDVPPLPRAEFEDKGSIDGEPSSDVLIELSDGRALRERMIETAGDASTTLSDAAAPTMRSIVISNALLNADGSVALDGEGRPILTTRHELVLTNEALGRLGSEEAVSEAVEDARRIAAAKADIEFRGRGLLDKVLGGRIRAAQ